MNCMIENLRGLGAVRRSGIVVQCFYSVAPIAAESGSGGG